MTPADTVLAASKALYSASEIPTSLFIQTAELLDQIADVMTAASATLDAHVSPVTVSGQGGYSAVFTAAYAMALQINTTGVIDVRTAPISGRNPR